MNKLIALFIFLLWPVLAFTKDVDIPTIIIIESSGNPSAIGTHGEMGLMQITPIVLVEYNNFHNLYLQFGSKQLFDPLINTTVGNWYINIRIPQMLKYYHIPDTINNRIWCYNAGIKNVLEERLPFTTRNYIQKYNHLINRRK